MADPTPPDRALLHPVSPLPFRERDEPHLPVSLTSFVGREREVALVATTLRRPGVRLVTLTGPGGVGKTRLSLRIAEEVAGDFPDGVWFVALASVRDPSPVATTIAQALGLRETGTRTAEETIRDYLRDRRALLVLDNFEHLLPAATLISDLLQHCPSLSALVTSRAVLQLSGEHDVAVSPLSLVSGDTASDLVMDSEAVRLFLERATAARSDFAPSEAELPMIAAICDKIDGLPLAIELAAARVRTLPIPALLAKLEYRLAMLTGGARDQPTRFRSMRDAIAWSHDLLIPQERQMFRRLAVFVGGFTLEAAEAVSWETGDGSRELNDEPSFAPDFRLPAPDALSVSVLDGIASLVDMSLLMRTDGPGPGGSVAPRYTMLETIREYGLEQLEEAGEEGICRDRHAAWYGGLAERTWEMIEHESISAHMLNWVEAEHDNLRTALAWLDRRGDAEATLRLAAHLYTFWKVRGHLIEARTWLERGLRWGNAISALVRARALFGMGMIAFHQREYGESADLFAESLFHCGEAGDPRTGVMTLLRLGTVAMAAGDNARAEPFIEEAIARGRDLGLDAWVALGRHELGLLALGQGDTARAEDLLGEALSAERRMQNGWGIPLCLEALGVVACLRGDLASATDRFDESLDFRRSVVSPPGFASWLAGMATMASYRGEAEKAGRLFGATAALAERIGETAHLPLRAIYEEAEAKVQSALSERQFNVASTAGRALGLDEAIAEARSLLTAANAADRSVPLTAITGLGLTRRERGVLDLLVEGRSDREIADLLFISPKTVGIHVGNVLGELGVSSRAAAVAYVHRHGLVSIPHPSPPS